MWMVTVIKGSKFEKIGQIFKKNSVPLFHVSDHDNHCADIFVSNETFPKIHLF